MNEYKTQSIALAAALQLLSTAKLVYIERNPGTSKVTFVFDRSSDPSFDNLVAAFFSRKLPVDSASYFDSLKFLKTRLYEE